VKTIEALGVPVTQAEFAALIRVSEAKVSQLVGEGVIERGQTAHAWLLAYVERLREVAAGRASDEAGGLDLVQERARLARSQREAQDIKNAVARGEFAPIGLLADVLGMASSAVVDRFEQLEGALRKACPDLPDEAKATVQQVIANARNEWIRATEKLVVAEMDRLASDDDASAEEAMSDEDGA
jgi:phage terminase Nu1 subunit (DNA packaging protein)